MDGSRWCFHEPNRDGVAGGMGEGGCGHFLRGRRLTLSCIRSGKETTISWYLCRVYFKFFWGRMASALSTNSRCQRSFSSFPQLKIGSAFPDEREIRLTFGLGILPLITTKKFPQRNSRRKINVEQWFRSYGRCARMFVSHFYHLISMVTS